MEAKKIEILIIFFTILNIISIILSLLFYHKDIKIFDKYRKNWKSYPITEISTNCTGNYTPLISSKIYGHSTYCNCTKTKYGKIFNNKCEKEHIESKCIQFNKIKEKNITKYKGTELCVLRNKTTYDELKTVNGSIIYGYLDTFNYSYTVQKKNNYSQFPITELKILSNDDANSEKYYNYTKIELNNNYTLIYYKNISNNSSIVIDVEMTINEKICANPEEGIFSQNNYEYNNKKGEKECKTKIANTLYDSSYKLLDTYSISNLFNENNISDYLNLSNQNINLYQINYFGVKEDCFKSLKVSYVFEINICYNTVRILIIIMLIWFIIFIILILKQVEKTVNEIVGFLFINIVFQFIIGLIAYSSISYSLFYYKNKCFNDIINELFDKHFLSSYIAYWIYMVGFFINFIIMFIVYCIENPTIDDQFFDLRENERNSIKSMSMNLNNNN